jgi:hypothetical protein
MEPRPWELPSLRLYAEDNGFYSLKPEPGSLQAVLLGTMLQCSKVMAPAIDPIKKMKIRKQIARWELTTVQSKKGRNFCILKYEEGETIFYK